MRKNYMIKIKANLSIYSKVKSSNVLDGSYKSIYKGKSMNFEDLREYVPGDNIKDIDWKATARSNTILLKQYIAEKKHNVMLVLDNGKKMLGDTSENELKKEVAILAAGTIAYLVNKNGDYIASIYSKDNDMVYHPFRLGTYNIENILYSYDKSTEKDSGDSKLNNSLEYISKQIRRRMIIFIITDSMGLKNIDEKILKRLSVAHDILAINIDDAFLYGEVAYDVEAEKTVAEYLCKNKKVQELEKDVRKNLTLENDNKMKKYHISGVTLKSEKEIVSKIIELLERHKYANNR